MEKKLDLKLLEVFLEVFHLRSITQAADALGMTQPGVSGALKRLQQQLGTELFVREGRGISPTHHAIQLATDIEPAFSSIHCAVGNLLDFDVQSRHTFRVFANEPMMQLLQPRVEADRAMGNCTIEFLIPPNDEEQLQQQLSLQKADLAIDVGPLNSLSYSSESLYRDDVVLICAKDHPRVSGSITLEQYFREKHIAILARRTNRYLADYFAEESLQQRIISCECQSLMSMMALVAKSCCLGVITCYLASEFAENFGLQVMPLPFSARPITHNLIWHKRREHHSAHRWLRNKLIKLADPGIM